jgi:hypothetical protein
MSNIIDVRFLKFGLVGLGGMVIDFSVTRVCKKKLQLNKYISNGDTKDIHQYVHTIGKTIQIFLQSRKKSVLSLSKYYPSNPRLNASPKDSFWREFIRIRVPIFHIKDVSTR